MMIPVPNSGVFEAVSGEEAARSVPGIPTWRSPPGCTMPLLHGPTAQAIWDFFLRRETRRERVEQALREAHEKLIVFDYAALPVEHPATRRMTN